MREKRRKRGRRGSYASGRPGVTATWGQLRGASNPESRNGSLTSHTCEELRNPHSGESCGWFGLARKLRPDACAQNLRYHAASASTDSPSSRCLSDSRVLINSKMRQEMDNGRRA